MKDAKHRRTQYRTVGLKNILTPYSFTFLGFEGGTSSFTVFIVLERGRGRAQRRVALDSSEALMFEESDLRVSVDVFELIHFPRSVKLSVIGSLCQKSVDA